MSLLPNSETPSRSPLRRANDWVNDHHKYVGPWWTWMSIFITLVSILKDTQEWWAVWLSLLPLAVSVAWCYSSGSTHKFRPKYIVESLLMMIVCWLAKEDPPIASSAFHAEIASVVWLISCYCCLWLLVENALVKPAVLVLIATLVCTVALLAIVALCKKTEGLSEGLPLTEPAPNAMMG